MPRDFKGVWIPKEIYLDERLGALDKIIFIEISSLDGKDGCFASNEYLAKFCQCSESKISRAIAHLIELGYIVVEKFNGRKRFLRAWPFKNEIHAENAMETRQKCEAPCEKVRHSNINNNIVNKERKKERGYDDIFSEKEVSGKLKEAFVEFIKSRELNKRRMTNRALELAIDKVRRMANEESMQIAIVNQSIENGWQGLFPLKEEKCDNESQVKEYKPNDNEDVTYKRIFDAWEQKIGYRPRMTDKNVEAVRDLLKTDGEEGLTKLIVALAMRRHHTFLTRDIKGTNDFVSLRKHKNAIWNFYNEHAEMWSKWAENAQAGKPRWKM